LAADRTELGDRTARHRDRELLTALGAPEDFANMVA
jgi:hypothetical protein